MSNLAHPALHCLHRPAADSTWRGRVLVSVSRGTFAGAAGELVSRFLSEEFGERFVETRNGVTCDLAVEAFYDLLRCNFSHHPAFVAAFGPLQPKRSAGDSDAEWLEFLAAMKPLTWLFHGLASLRRDRAAGRILVRFGELPGAIEFAAAAPALSPAPDAAEMTTAGEDLDGDEVSVCYGFGCSERHPAEIVETLTNFARDPGHLPTSIWHAVHV